MLEATTKTEEWEGDANTSLRNEKKYETKDRNETESLSEKSANSCHSNKQGVDGMEAAMVTSPPEETIKKPNSETERVCLISELDENWKLESDASLDESYVQSVGECMEPSQTPVSCSQQQRYKPSLQAIAHTPPKHTRPVSLFMC